MDGWIDRWTNRWMMGGWMIEEYGSGTNGYTNG